MNLLPKLILIPLFGLAAMVLAIKYSGQPVGRVK